MEGLLAFLSVVMLLQYMGIAIGILMEEIETKKQALLSLIPFYWAYCIAKAIVINIKKLE